MSVSTSNLNSQRPAVQRLFFALWPDDEVRRQLQRVAADVVLPPGGRWVPAHKLHMTLLFLGSVGADVCACLEQGAGGIQLPGFSLKLADLGYWRRPRVLWLGSDVLPDALVSLVAALRGVAEACGVELEQRAFRAHITLARKVARFKGKAMSRSEVGWPVRHFALVASNTEPEGAHYRIVKSWPLV